MVTNAQTQGIFRCVILNTEATQQEVSDVSRTDDVCGDAGLGEQRGDLLLVDVFALSLAAVRVDVDQQVFGSAGCYTNNHVSHSLCVCVCYSARWCKVVPIVASCSLMLLTQC